MKVFVVGYPYIRENYFATFRYYPKKNGLIFLLPKIWKAKEGRVIFYPSKDSNIIKARTFFSHSNYFLIGGAFKGFIMAFPWVLFKQRKNVGLVYSCSEPILFTTLYYSFFSRLFGKKHICFSWENIPFEKKFRGIKLFIKKSIIKLNLFFSDGVICGNQKGAEIYKKLTEKPVAVIPMSGVDPEFFKPVQEIQRRFRNRDLSNFLIYTFIGAVDFRKGLYIALQAFKKLLVKTPDARFIIAGSGNYEKEIKQQIIELGLADYVFRYPWLNHSEVRDLLSVSDIFLYPSIAYGGWEEQFGYSMAEASLMELPVISTRSGSIPDVVIDGKTGILAEPDNVTQLADAMVRLAMDGVLRTRLGHEGRKYIMRRFSHVVVAQRFFEFFNRVNGTRAH